MATNQPSTESTGNLTPSNRLQELSDSEGFEDLESVTNQMTMEEHPHLALIQTPLKDELQTASSEVQDETVDVILPYLESNPDEWELNSYGIPKLQREKHVAFLHQALGNYPARFVALDAARNWFFNWALQGLTALGEDISDYTERVTYTLAASQHPSGGHGGGHGQLPHLATTYAAVLSIAMVGGEQAYSSIDRKGMWHFLGRMKQADGGFTMAPGGEEDIRGAYCAMIIISLLDLPLELPPESSARIKGDETFLTNLGQWVGRCQTYEGGIGAAPDNEAHGAYAFCAVGCLSIIGPPYETLPKYLNMDTLLSWLASRQMGPEGGYSGRTNKLVDGCYSHWVGSCGAIVEAALAGPNPPSNPSNRLFNRSTLVRYVLSCCQGKRGGLRDKPGKPPDAYHTCYNLAGLSAAQHRFEFNIDSVKALDEEHKSLNAAFGWMVVANADEEGKIWDDSDEVDIVHPIFVIPWAQAGKCRRYFADKEGF